jgi:hypothetical protein
MFVLLGYELCMVDTQRVEYEKLDASYYSIHLNGIIIHIYTFTGFYSVLCMDRNCNNTYYTFSASSGSNSKRKLKELYCSRHRCGIIY